MVRRLGAILLTCSVLLSAGCIKIRLTVQLNEDGSGRVVEDIVFGERVVDGAKRLPNAATIEKLTGDAHLQKRVAHMGKGIRLAGKKIDKQPDGSVRMSATYAFDDINDLKLAPVPYGPGWENLNLKFDYYADPTLDCEYHLDVRFENAEGKGRGNSNKPEQPLLSEREAQQIRQLLPVFKDMLTGFDLKLRIEVYEQAKWASFTKGHGTGGPNSLSAAGGRLTLFQITDKHLQASDDGLMIVVPWRQEGRESSDLYHGHYPPGLRLLPHVHTIDRGSYRHRWRAIQTPRGREYY